MEVDIEVLHKFIDNALQEDVGDGDHTSLSTIPEGKQGSAKLLIKEDGEIAGVDVALEICKKVYKTLKVDVFIKDCANFKYGDIVLHVTGSAYSILGGERLVLISIQRMSGIATTTTHIANVLKN